MPALRTLLFLLVASSARAVDVAPAVTGVPVNPSATPSAKAPAFRDQVSEIEQTSDGRYRVKFLQRGIVYTVPEQDKDAVRCLMRSVKLLKDVDVEFDPEGRRVLGCGLVVPK